MPERLCPRKLLCSECEYTTVCGLGEIASWLSRLGKLRRDKNPEPELLFELFSAASADFQCPQCGHQGLAVSVVKPSGDEDWGMARKCEVCGRPIPPERLEIFPKTTVCMACKQGEEHGPPQEELPFCPKCGALMKTQTARAEITRYVYRCTECGHS